LQIPLWDFGWLDATRYLEETEAFRLPTRDRLARLISSRDYRNSFATLESWKTDPGPIHGPFRLDAISASTFEEISFPELQRRVQSRLTGPEFQPVADNDQRRDVWRLVHRIAQTSRHCFFLNLDRRDKALQHEWGFVHSVFDEYAVLEEDALWLVVIGCD
jgi:hypothetical protein